MANEKIQQQSAPAGREFSLTLFQKIAWSSLPLIVSIFIVIYQPLLPQGGTGTMIFIAMGLLLGIVTWYVSAGWTFKATLTQTHLRVRDSKNDILMPLDRIGLVTRNAVLPFPVIWVVLRNAEVGRPIPDKGVDNHAKALIEAYQKRNPGKTLTFVALPGGHLRSATDFAKAMKEQVPAIVLDERLL